MAKEPRPKGYPKLKNYKPSQFMLPTSHYDKKKADRAVTFIENLCHTKGKWAGTPFWLLPWQEQLIRDIFGIVKPDGNRQFRTVFVEICKKVGKSELATAVAFYLLYADNEPSAEVYGAAADRQQASIVFDVAKQMVEMSPALMKRSKLMGATKRIVNYGNAGYYQVLSAEVGGKHRFSVSGLVFDKIHTKAVDILEGRRVDPTFYPVIYGLKDDEDWEDEANGYRVNPSLEYTVDVERLRDAYREAEQNPADEVTFKWLRCNMWVSSTTAWISDEIYMRGNEPIDMDALEGRDCYAGLDLSSTGDITALVLMFPPRNETEKYILLPFFWVPEDTIPRRVKVNSVPYDGSSVYTKKTQEQNADGSYVTITAEFRRYGCVEDSIADHSAYLLEAKNGNKLRYDGLKGCTDYKKAVQIIKDGGYATSLTYVEKLCSIIERWKLTQYDVAGKASDVIKYYRVRKSWEDAASQLGAYTVLANAKAMADKHPGYDVYDWNGKQVYPEVAEGAAGGMTNADCPFLVKVSIPDLNIRKGAGTNTAKTGICTGIGVFTIMEVKNGKGSDTGWGRLKSGAGWISLDYCHR